MNLKLTEFLEKVKESGSILGLSQIEKLCKLLGQPQNQIPAIHVAGTNGKGSVCAMLEAGLIATGFQVGKYSSPAVFSPEEIISVNGHSIKKKEMTQLLEFIMERWKEMYEDIVPTMFEIETAAAFLFFIQKKCDIMIIETGLGGRFDATNIIKQPLLSIITSISLDHCQILGNTLAEIAGQKAGIIKSGCDVVVYRQDESVLQVIQKEAENLQSKVWITDPNSVEMMTCCPTGMIVQIEINGKKRTTEISLVGMAQIENAKIMACALGRLASRLEIDVDVFLEGMAHCSHPGRMEVVHEHPVVIIDGAHNPSAAQKLKETLVRLFPNQQFRFIVGVFADKDYKEELTILLPLAKKVYTIKPNSPRGLASDVLATAAKKLCLQVEDCGVAVNAIHIALAETDQDEIIVAFGSLSFLKEIKEGLSQ